MDSPSAITFMSEPPSDASSASQVSGRLLAEDVASLTSFNPFSEEDENDHSSYALMTSLFSRVKNTFTTPLSSAPPSTAGPGAAGSPNSAPVERKRPSASAVQNHSSSESSRSSTDRPPSLTVVPSHAAPPLVSLTPVVSEELSFNTDLDLPLPRAAFFNTSVSENMDGGLYGTTIPGFSIPEDARSIRTSVSVKRSASVSKVIRRIRGEGMPP